MNIEIEGKKLKEAAMKAGLLSDKEDTISVNISDIVDAAIFIKQQHDELTKNLTLAKGFFTNIGQTGDVFEGSFGKVSLIGRSSTVVDPRELRGLLSSLGRSEELLDMVSVKVKDTREMLGTTLFNKVAVIDPNASITVKITKKK